ncbi:hypothetical protein HWB52_gp35 [Pseudomonas phage Littlefix]|uniref:Uncharacterized protein n=1 Tax=Pseudomonas phage Littlefix TaxID=2079289 RepID=A0A2K9VHQ0_9CAUD|nr:hypothetical protein HWB52_gp35 [Pseudomonas phage Littlefix]AUV61850.1 hypothetical protein PsPhLittlefix_gp35 [Pseudomonas phage Littlefix]
MAARVNNYHVVITTAIATFAMSRPIQDSPDMVNWVAKQISETNNADVSIYLNGVCKAQHKVFADGHVPAVWTHTPLPVGMAAAALQTKFEERAAVVLGDADSGTNFALWKSGTHSNADNRYIDPTVRAAWMMYVDQAIEHFVATK